MLKQRALTATIWSGAEIFLRQGLRFAITIVLARLLTPAEFGTVALLALFIGIATMFVDGGFSAALIQRQDVDHTDESTVFWFNLGIGIAAALGLAATSPVIATFYKVPVLRPLTLVMAFTVFAGALGAIHSTLLSKRLDFRTQMKASVLATLISGGVAILMAWMGYGVWALAAQALTATSVTTALLWIFNPWRPAWIFSRTSVSKLFGFGGYHLASSLLEITYNRLYTLLVGKLYGVTELGFYNNADAMKQMPGGFLTTLISRAAFPLFSAAAQDTSALRRGLQLSIRGVMLINVPVMLGIAALAKPLVETLFGPSWLPSAPVLRVLCIGGVLYPLHAINLQVLLAQGHSRLMFHVEVTKKAVGIALIIAGACFGIIGIAWSQVAFSLIALVLNTRYSKRLVGYGITYQIIDFAPALVIGSLMAITLYTGTQYMKSPPWIELFALSGIGAALYLGLAKIFDIAALDDVLSLFRSGVTPKNSAGNDR